MNIIFTRPLMDSEDLMAGLFSLGHKMIHIPTLKISPIKTKIVELNNYDAVIFTSANAIKYLKTSSKNKNIICFCVGSITEKIARANGFINTISAGGTVNALKNLILNNARLNKGNKIAYVCGDNISTDLDSDLLKEGFEVKKIINYQSEKITQISDQDKKLVETNPPHLIFVYSKRSAESFIQLVKKYSLYPLMTGSVVMCISKKVSDVFIKEGWKKTKVFNPGDELLNLKLN